MFFRDDNKSIELNSLYNSFLMENRLLSKELKEAYDDLEFVGQEYADTVEEFNTKFNALKSTLRNVSESNYKLMGTLMAAQLSRQRLLNLVSPAQAQMESLSYTYDLAKETEPIEEKYKELLDEVASEQQQDKEAS